MATKTKVAFVTTNKHKFVEVKDILKNYPIELEHVDLDYEENHDHSLEEIARAAAQKLANQLNQPVIVEDTGLYFDAYDGFPGALPKFVVTTLGFDGIFKLLDGVSRQAHFRTVAAFCHPNQDPVLFDGVMAGTITTTVHNQDKDVMPYDKIFVPDGKTKTISELSLAEKNKLSQRAQAFTKFGQYIADRYKEEKR